MARATFDPKHFVALGSSVRFDVPLKDYVYYGIGGPADVFVSPKDEDQIQKAVGIFNARGIPFFVLGSGTNLLVRDGGLRGAVLYLGAGLPGDLQILSEDGAAVLLRVPAHWPKARLLGEALHRSWAGLEFSAGIPGTIVQGRYDMICPPLQAWRLAQGWRRCDLRMVTLAGHALSEPGISAELVHVMDGLRPMLKEWLDDNLPGIVERLVRAEIERVARGGR